jgi:hypothetical protein
VPESLKARRDLYAPDPLAYGISAYTFGLADMLAMAESRTLTLGLRQENIAQPLQLLDDGRPALREFARRAVGPEH